MADLEPTRATSLPPPDGVWGHLRHSWAVVRLLRTWRRQYQVLDDQLREAVQVRDLRLAELGESAYSARGQLTGELAAFSQTLDEQTTARDRADQGVQNAGIDLAAAEAERTEVLGKRETELRAARADLTGPERELADLEARITALDREAKARDGQSAAARTQIAELEADAALDEADRARREADRAKLEEQLATWARDEERQATQRRELEAPLEALRERVERLTTAFSNAKDTYREARQVHDTRVESARAALAAAENEYATTISRRRAVAIDLARGVLERSELALPGRPAAEEAMARIEAIRAERSSLDAEWEAFDGSAARRTAWCIGGTLIALIVLWIII